MDNREEVTLEQLKDIRDEFVAFSQVVSLLCISMQRTIQEYEDCGKIDQETAVNMLDTITSVMNGKKPLGKKIPKA